MEDTRFIRTTENERSWEVCIAMDDLVSSLAERAGYPVRFYRSKEDMRCVIDKQSRTISFSPINPESLSFHWERYKKAKRSYAHSPANIIANVLDDLTTQKKSLQPKDYMIIASKSKKYAKGLWNGMWRRIVPLLNQDALRCSRTGRNSVYAGLNQVDYYNLLCEQPMFLQLAKVSPTTALLLGVDFQQNRFIAKNKEHFLELLKKPLPELIAYITEIDGKTASQSTVYFATHAPIYLTMMHGHSLSSTLELVERAKIDINHLRKIRTSRQWVMLFAAIEFARNHPNENNPLFDFNVICRDINNGIHLVIDRGIERGQASTPFSSRCSYLISDIFDYYRGVIPIFVDNNLRFTSFARAYRESTRWHRQQEYLRRQARGQRGNQIAQLGNHESFDPQAPFADFGFTILEDREVTIKQLLCPADLDEESEEMHHCVGWGGYDHPCVKGDIAIFSVFYKEQRVATMELSKDLSIRQLRGKHNGKVDEAVERSVKHILKQNKNILQVAKPSEPVITIENAIPLDAPGEPDGVMVYNYDHEPVPF